MSTPKGRPVTLRISAAEDTLLDQIADHYSLNPQSVLRMLIKREATALGLAESKSVKKGGRT